MPPKRKAKTENDMQKIEIEKFTQGWTVRDHSSTPRWLDCGCATLDDALSRARCIGEDFDTPKRTETETMLLEALDRIARFATGGQLQQMAAEAIAKHAEMTGKGD
jgi:hypothetical protein